MLHLKANELAGRKVLDVKRYGKVFYLELDGDGKMPVLHLGMTGMVQVSIILRSRSSADVITKTF